jgi:hypothetical protein
MEKLQADNGWQTRIVPDSRAIIKLGLGPSTSAAASTGASAETPETTTLFAGDAATVHPSNQ